MQNLKLVILIALALALLVGCAPSQPAVTGTIIHKEAVTLPADAVVIVKVEDVSRADAPAITIAEQTIKHPKNFPIPFEVKYDPAQIDPRYSYALRVRIESEGKLIFINTSRYAVITRDSPTQVEVAVDKVGR